MRPVDKAIAARVDPLPVRARLAFGAALAERFLEAIGDRLPVRARDASRINLRALWDAAEGRADPESLDDAGDRQHEVNVEVFEADEYQPGFEAGELLEMALYVPQNGVQHVAEAFQRFVSDPYYRRWTRERMAPGETATRASLPAADPPQWQLTP